jgi:hypothetical protein
MDYPEDRRALLEYLREFMDNNVEKRSAPSYDELVDYLNALEDIKDENSAVTSPDYEEAEGSHKRSKRGEPFIPAMSAPSPPFSIFSNGVDKKRLIPDQAEDTTDA